MEVCFQKVSHRSIIYCLHGYWGLTRLDWRNCLWRWWRPIEDQKRPRYQCAWLQLRPPLYARDAGIVYTSKVQHPPWSFSYVIKQSCEWFLPVHTVLKYTPKSISCRIILLTRTDNVTCSITSVSRSPYNEISPTADQYPASKEVTTRDAIKLKKMHERKRKKEKHGISLRPAEI